jgi:hypothetical protein
VDVDHQFVAILLNAVQSVIVNDERPTWQQRRLIQTEAFGSSVFLRSKRASSDWIDALALAVGCVTSYETPVDAPRTLRLCALIELCEYRQHYVEVYGARFISDAVDGLLGQSCTAKLDTSVLVVFANMLNKSIAVVDGGEKE